MQEVFWPPPDSPKTMTLLGSPPKLAMFWLTQLSAWRMSSMPWLPEVAYSSPAMSARKRKPSKPRR